MANIFANYSNTVIYKISCKDEYIKDAYIGHTTSFYQRERLHRSNCNNTNSKAYNYKIYKIIRENGGWDNWKMEIIENYPCKDINEAKQRERFWIEKESTTLNITIPNRSKKEYGQIYNLINKENISETAKLYRINNKDKIKEYIDTNKEKIKIKKQDWYEEKKIIYLKKQKNTMKKIKNQNLNIKNNMLNYIKNKFLIIKNNIKKLIKKK